ncbi:hypothetical protein CANARDRAFT_9332 [[Candida] arabinofermentans NRRL YB-2248]|uniref:Uncharacterized protein n=1 Tax=[Candida] arabinofermentans NRRL YB-2248 TaxID=983967 RepID=A0A1E4SWA0_9ASCO|nr:hypothetical protein CANARDRAFT_9332 [[Candida] arabinofermentans NRRL YB-2248]
MSSSIVKVGTIASNPATQRATAVHLSYDSKSDRIVYASGKSIFIRSLKNPSECIQFNNHNFNTTVAKFSPSGYYVASGDESGNVKIWDCVGEDLIVKGEYQIINGRINDIAWDADSTRVIAVGNGKERYGHCFTADSGNTVGEISGHTAPINAVSIRPCRPYRAVTVSDDAGLVFMNGPPFKFAQSVRGHHKNFVRDVKFSKDGNYIVSVGADRMIVLYDGKTGDFIKQFSDSHDAGIFSVDWYDESSFVTGSADSTVKLWNVEGELLNTWTLKKDLTNQILGVVTASEYVVALTYSGDLYYFDKSSESPVNAIYGHQKSITALSFSSENGLYTGSYDGRIIKWDLDSKTGTLVEGDSHSNLVIGIEEIGNELITAGWDDSLKKISGSVITSLSSLTEQPVQIAKLNSSIAVITEQALTIYDLAGTVTESLTLDYTPSAIAVSSKYIILADSTSFALKVYDSSSLKLLSSSLQPMRAKPSLMKVSPNGKFLACGDTTGKINCYNLEDFSLVTSRWAFHTAKINSMSWSEDNDHIVTASLDTNIYIYSAVKPARNIKALNAHKEGVNAVAWISADEVVSSGTDSCVKFWKVKYA